jgi:hypothetical protein
MMADLTGLGRRTLWAVTSGKENYMMDSYILLMGTLDEIIGLKDYKIMDFLYKSIGHYSIARKCTIIENHISIYFGISKDLMISNTRKKEVIRARMLCYKLEFKYTNITITDIAKRFDKASHATVLSALRRFDNLKDTRDPWLSVYNELDKHFSEIWKMNNVNLRKPYE